MKRLFVCCDGTWNAPTDVHDGVPVPTNVVRFYNALVDGFAPDGVEQVRYYHPGVGSEEVNFIERAIAGATGKGLTRNVKSAYAWLTTRYEPGDEIFLLGFSRGAFTARALSGLIWSQGIHRAPINALGAREADWRVITRAYRACEKKKPRGRPDPDFCFPDIHFLGVWDTVGALGIPPEFPRLPLFFAFAQPRFHDTELTPNVVHAYHALALDEKRRTFSPTLWTKKAAGNKEVIQMWFAGVHADVGGGYRETDLSNIALDWMIERAETCGARFEVDMRAQAQAYGGEYGVLHDSCTGVFSRALTQPRRMPTLDPLEPEGPMGQRVHPTVHERQRHPPISQAPYRPLAPMKVGDSRTFTVFAREKWNWTGLYVEPMQEYEIESAGHWTYSGKETGPEGQRAIGWIQPRRFAKARWMSLVGAIADFANPDQEGQIQELETFAVGEKAKLVLDPLGGSPLWGYLYFFANVLESQFEANRGSLQVSVTRVR